jgi:ATP-dependent Lon protease
MVVHLDVGREKSIEAINAAMLSDKLIFLSMQKDASVDDPRAGDIYRMGTVVRIKQCIKLPGGTVRLLVEGMHRGRVERFTGFSPYVYVYGWPRSTSLLITAIWSRSR